MSTVRSVVYSCTRGDLLEETFRSAASFARIMPDVRRVIHIPENIIPHLGDRFLTRFDQVRVHVKFRCPLRPRFDAMKDDPGGPAIYLDGDTLLLEPIPELFDALHHFDLVMVAAPQGLNPLAIRKGIYEILPEVSPAIGEWNGGVIVTRADSRFRQLVCRWEMLYHRCKEYGYELDQPGLRSAVVNSDMRVATVPANYNLRAMTQQVIHGRVKLLHAHGNLEAIAARINETTGCRVYRPQPGEVEVYQ